MRKSRLLITLATALTSLPTLAEMTAFEKALENSAQVRSEERWVDRKGKRYREVRIEGETYYLHFRDNTEGVADLDCEIPSPETKPSVDAGVEVFRRTKLFVQALRVECEKKYSQTSHTITLDPRVGFTIPDDPKASLKKRSIYTKPTQSPNLNFGAEF